LTFFSVATTTQSSPRMPTVVKVLVFTRLNAYSAHWGARAGGSTGWLGTGDGSTAAIPSGAVSPIWYSLPSGLKMVR